MFVRAPNPIWFMVDLIGLPLNDEYFAFFLTNTLPYLPQAVFRDPQGMTEWTGNVIEFFPNGTLPDNLYFDPNLVYRIEIRHGDSQSDPLIYEINNFVPGTGMSITPTDFSILSAGNQASNSTFSEVSFLATPPTTAPSITINAAGTYNIAPGWQLTLSGTGTTTITQLIFSGAGSASSPNAINYALRFNNNGWASATLFQRFNNNGGIFTGGAISMQIAAAAEITNQRISLIYQPSDSGTPVPIVSNALVTTGDFQIIEGTVRLDPSVNSDLSAIAYVDMQIILPPTGIIDVTDFQVVGQSNSIPLDIDITTINPAYQQISNERELSNKFWYFKEPLARKRIPSYLVGWDFANNPAQFLGPSVAAQAVGANKSYYAWDQTILFQSANSGITVSRGNSGIKLLAAATTQVAMIQYLTGFQIAKLIESFISINVSAFTSTVSGNGVNVTISLFYTKDVSLPSTVGSNLSIVSALSSNGKPTSFNGNWIEIPPVNNQQVTFTVGSASNLPFSPFNQYPLDGKWIAKNITDANLATYFAIVIGTSSITSGDAITFESVGLTTGMIATAPAPKTYDETLRECQYYYEQSYLPGIVPGTLTNVAMKFALMTTFIDLGPLNVSAGIQNFELNFNVIKVQQPVISIYNPFLTNTIDSTRIFLYNGGANVSSGDITFSTYLDFIDLNLYRANYKVINGNLLITNHTVPIGTTSANIYFHYLADSRLGI